MKNRDQNLIVCVLPYSTEDTWDESVDTAAPYLRGLEKDYGRGVIVQNAKSRFGGSLDALTIGRSVSTPRSPGSHRGPVFAYCPDEDALLLSQHIAVGGMVIVAYDDPWIAGWARQLGAFNIRNQEYYAPFGERQVDLIDQIHRYGNNGWPKRDSLLNSVFPRLVENARESGLEKMR